MADDERRTTRPALHDAMHVERDPRRIYQREHSVGFCYTNQPASVPSLASPPLSSRGYTPTGPIHMAGPSRRPLPTPRTRPESMPPPHRQVPLVVQAPAPSRPAILASSATLAVSPTAPPARRPLPTPALSPARPTAKHTSIDLTARPTSPVKSVISTIDPNPDRGLRIPSSFSRRTTPLPDTNQRPLPPPATPFSTSPPTWSRSSRADTHETHEPEAVPFWNRNIPAASSAPIGANVMERRSTVSGALPPALPLPRHVPRRAESPERPQRAHFSPRRPLPSSPTEPPHVPSLHQCIPPPSEEDDPHASSPLSDQDVYEPMTFADPMQAEDDEHEIIFAKSAHTASPQFGIRDLPTRSRIAIANRDASQTAFVTPSNSQRDRVTQSPPALPQPPTSSVTHIQAQTQTNGHPQSPRAHVSPSVSSSFTSFSNRSHALGTFKPEPQSLTLRFASMGLAEEREREREKQTLQASNPSPVQSPILTASGPASPVRQQQGWPSNVPPLPRTPGTTRPFFGTANVPAESQPFKPNGTTSPPASLPTSPTHPARAFPSSPNANATFDRKSFAQQSPRPLSHLQSQPLSQLSERQLQKQRVRDNDIDLDDAPPPSLRRSPSPIRQGFTQAPIVEITSDTPPRRQWTPSHEVTSRTSNESTRSNSYAGFRAESQPPERKGRPLTQPCQTAVPKTSPPDRQHYASDVDDASSPSIVVSGPGSATDVSVSVSTPDTPATSHSVTPSVTISGHEPPAISVSAVDSSSMAFSPPKIAVSDAVQSQKPGPSPGSFGSRHTHIQELSSHPAPGRGPASKRGLPPPPSSNIPVRTNGLSCGGCNGPIIGHIVSAMGQRWHPHCFKCTICNELLEHVSSYERDGRPYCHLDYHETFAPRCFHCKTAIIDERFITLDDPALGKRTYHEQHFFCAECGDPFLAPTGPLPPSVGRTGELSLAGDGEFVDDDVGFTVYKGHPYCEACHVRLRMPKCKACKKSIRDGAQAVEALGGKWCWSCFVCEGCKNPFEDPSFFLRNEKPFCEPCFSLILRNEV